MVALDTVNACNASLLEDKTSPYVAVFFGASSTGIGSATLFALAKRAADAHSARQNSETGSTLRVYIVYRNAQKGNRILEECKKLAPHATFTLVEAKDLSRMRDVDLACAKIRELEQEVVGAEKQPKIDLLVCCQGGIYWKREETSSGLLMDITMHYYSRARAMHNLVPLLSAGSTPGHVINVYAAGMEDVLDRNDLGLADPNAWTFNKARSHCVYMTTMFMERLAHKNPGKLSLANAFPGLVVHEGFDSPDHPAWFKVVWRIFGPIASRFFSYSLEESGERTLFLASKDYFPPVAGTSVAAPTSSLAAVSTDGRKGGGAYAVGHKGDVVDRKKQDQKYAVLGDRAEFEQQVWDHTLQAFERGAQ